MGGAKHDPLARLVDATEDALVDEGAREREINSPTVVDGDDLEPLVAPISRARSFAERWDGPYRAEVFRVALELLVNARTIPTDPARLQRDHPGPAITRALGAGSSATDKVARHSQLTPDEVERTVTFGENEKIVILARIPGSSKKELQTQYSLLYLYLSEIGLGSRLVDIEELRKLCVEQGCYDTNNFTANFRKDVQSGLLREQGEKGGRTRRYLLSQKGILAAADLFRTLARQ
jgi:hypothetical protein